MGFAKVAHFTRSPIIPVYTENIRLAYRTLQSGNSFFRSIFEATKLPFIPFYGGFPVELITHVGKPIVRKEGESMVELQQRVQTSMRNIIAENRGHKSVLAALDHRFSCK